MFAQKTEAPHRDPGKCKGCGAGSITEREWWIDTGTYEDFYGQVYYCNICFTEMCNLVGFISSDQYTELEKELENAERRIEELDASFDAARRLGVDLDAINRFVQDHYVSSERTEDRLDELIERAASAGKQANEQGSDDIPDPKPIKRGKLAL